MKKDQLERYVYMAQKAQADEDLYAYGEAMMELVWEVVRLKGDINELPSMPCWCGKVYTLGGECNHQGGV